MTEPSPSNPSPAVSGPSPSKASFWQRLVVDPVIAQLTQGITPEKVALTLAVGSALALFPIFGTATLLCLIVGIALRLNQPLIQLVNALFTVPHLFVVYGLIRFGDFVFGLPQPQLTLSEFLFRKHIHISIWEVIRTLWKDHTLYLHELGTAALHALVAWVIIAPFWIFVVYRITRPALTEAARRRGAPVLHS